MVSWSWFWWLSLYLSYILLIPVRTFHVTWSECVKQRRSYAWICFVILVLHKERLCGKRFSMVSVFKVASLVSWCLSMLHRGRAAGWLCCCVVRSVGVSVRFPRDGIWIPLLRFCAFFLFLFSKDITWRSVPLDTRHSSCVPATLDIAGNVKLWFLHFCGFPMASLVTMIKTWLFVWLTVLKNRYLFKL